MSVSPLSPGDIVTTRQHRYEVLEHKKDGGAAHVYLVADEQGVHRIVKLLQAQHLGNQHMLGLFSNEIESIRRTQGTYVVGIVDEGALEPPHPPLPFYVMEYMEGGNLHDLVTTRGALDAVTAATFGMQIAAALEKAHLQDKTVFPYSDGIQRVRPSGTELPACVIHRDVTPSNILLDPLQESVKLGDFGAAIQATGAAAPNQDNVRTQSFASPEQRRKDREITTASDIYQLGGTLFWALSFIEPVQLNGVALDRLRPGLDPSLAEYLSRMLREEPWERPTATEVRQKLAELRLLLSTPTTASATLPALPPKPAFTAQELGLRLAGKAAALFLAAFVLCRLLMLPIMHALQASSSGDKTLTRTSAARPTR
jgi:serine/threonine-protein kinase